MSLMVKLDLAVVGAGPAGLSAAAEVARRGLATVVIDEYPLPGGRLLGQLNEEPLPDGTVTWWKGIEVARNLVGEVAQAGARIWNGVQVWGLSPALGTGPDPGWEVFLHGGPTETVLARAVLLATGATERPLPVRNWTLPGAITVGAAQVFTNLHRVRPGKRVLICGVDPLSLTVARELSLAGSEVLGMVLPPAGQFSGQRAVPRAVIRELSRFSSLAPSWLLSLGGWMGTTDLGSRLGAALYPREGLRVWGIPLMLKQALAGITGKDDVTGAAVVEVDLQGRPRPGTERQMVCDCVALSGGLAPLVELASVAGCRLVPSGLGGAVPLHGPEMETELPGLYIAGNITGVEGARVAMAQGRIAGLTISRDLKALACAEYSTRLMEERFGLSRIRAGSTIQFYPGPAQAREGLEARWKARRVDLAG